MIAGASLQALLQRHLCRIVDASAAILLAAGNDESPLEPRLWDPLLLHFRDVYLAWEVECCRQMGAPDGGTHVIAVAQTEPAR